ncbi:MAG: MBL fold metallo-hydrolase [Dehalococcoidia bacterium]|jgi:ribonuclease BN (tRNA processing enzyme)|nr:MBL fold metallo-hydrolase [Dehalococcoidia bacterium]MDP6226231.1 MBL fold metallo-hydrolase [Dehalococcoidia bacterium]MDP7084256.1 MBL fold metallo-hydrolase [Dehalococcoidia bacterium]MDP7201376.1 MBL fold metallo-hydrolase [Dehalococcoidia bacterium]MDP7510000.1 MBL fold metallo-hydrolase [Dehalococcoidia bacterium]
MARIYLLGTGTPTPTPDRFGSSHVIEVAGEYLMFDCGPAATHKLVKAGLWPTQIDYLFFSHHHFDHDVDYPCFLLCRWDQSVGKENQLKVYGPTLTETITDRILGEEIGAFSHDWKARINNAGSQRVYVNRGGTLPRKPPSVDVHDIGPGLVHTGKDWKVTAAVAEHAQPWLDCLAYRLDSSEGSIVFTGDTRPCESVTGLAKDADVMLCMCWGHTGDMDATGEGQTSMCGTLGAAAMAQEAGVKRLVLVHTGPGLCRPGSMEKGIGDIKKVYDGELVFGEELMVLDV